LILFRHKDLHNLGERVKITSESVTAAGIACRSRDLIRYLA